MFWVVRVFAVREVVVHSWDRDAKAALESAESADPQSANVPARRVLGGYPILKNCPELLSAFSKAFRVPQIVIALAPSGASTATEDRENRCCASNRIQFRTGRFQMAKRRIAYGLSRLSAHGGMASAKRWTCSRAC
jgi:hypothetical protein